MAQTLRMAAAGVLLATLISTVAFLAFPPGLRLDLGGQEKGYTEAAFAPRLAAHSFHLAGGDDMSWVGSLGLDPAKLGENLSDANALILAKPAPPGFGVSLITQESVVYLTSSAAITGLSWAEEDIIIPLYRSALASAGAQLRAEIADAASSMTSVERVRDIIAISEYLLQGEDYSELPDEMKSYALSVGLTNLEGLFTRQGDGRFGMSAELARFESSVMWANYATGFEMSRDISCLAVLGFTIAADAQPWLQLSSFYSGLLGFQPVDCSVLSSAAVSTFGHRLDEEKLADSTLLDGFSSMISGGRWAFPFPVMLSESPLSESFSGFSHLGEGLLGSLSQLRTSRLSGTDGLTTQASGMTGLWLDLLLIAPWRASADRVAEAITGSYLMLSNSHALGVGIDFAQGQSLLVESNPELYSSLDAFLIGTYRYIESCVGVSERVTALMLFAHDILSRLTRGADYGSAYVSVDSGWAQGYALLLRTAGLDPTLSVGIQVGQKLDRTTVEIVSTDVGGHMGMLYRVSEIVDEG